MTDSLTYVFCLVKGVRRPSTRGLAADITRGLDVRVLPAGEQLWIIVASVPARDYNEAALARGLQDLDWVGRQAMVHESVVEHFLSAPALLPMQLFTLFTSDERALDHVARDRRRIERILSRIESRVEWGLRLTFDESAARSAARGTAKARESGTAYLARKRDVLDVNRTRLADARVQANRLYAVMARAATEARRRTATEAQGTPGSRVLLDAAFLVPSRRSGAFRSTLRTHARGLAGSGLTVSLTGPWPPYNFIDSRTPSRRSRSVS